jgi:hypothetical protein
LARSVPGNLATPVDVDHRRIVVGAFLRKRAFSGRIHGGMLQQEDGVWSLTGDDRTMDCALELKALNIRHGVGA